MQFITYMTASMIPHARLQPMAAASNWRTPALPSSAVSPALSVTVNTMIRPKRISPKRLAGSRYLGTKRFIFSSPRHLSVWAFALNRDDQHKRSIAIGPKSYGRPRMYLGIYSWQNSKQDLCAHKKRISLITNFNPPKSCLLNRQKHPSPR